MKSFKSLFVYFIALGLLFVIITTVRFMLIKEQVQYFEIFNPYRDGINYSVEIAGQWKTFFLKAKIINSQKQIVSNPVSFYLIPLLISIPVYIAVMKLPKSKKLLS